MSLREFLMVWGNLPDLKHASHARLLSLCLQLLGAYAEHHSNVEAGSDATWKSFGPKLAIFQPAGVR